MRKYSIGDQSLLTDTATQPTSTKHKPHSSVSSRVFLSTIDNELNEKIQGMSEILERMGKENPNDKYFKALFKGFQENINDLEEELAKEIVANENAQKKIESLSSTISGLQFEVSKLKGQSKIHNKGITLFALKETCKNIQATGKAKELIKKALNELEKKIRDGNLLDQDLVLTNFLAILMNEVVKQDELRSGKEILKYIANNAIKTKINITTNTIIQHLTNLQQLAYSSFKSKFCILQSNIKALQLKYLTYCKNLEGNLLNEKTNSMQLLLEVEKLREIKRTNEQLQSHTQAIEELKRKKAMMTQETLSLSEHSHLYKELKLKNKEIKNLKHEISVIKKKIKANAAGCYVIIGLMIAMIVIFVCFQPINLLANSL